jgi:dihydroorotate dehydrogenase (NAD+) catalytic subunit
MAIDLSIEVLRLRLAHPLMNASGILGYLPEHVEILESYGVSAIVSKTFTLKPREGHREPVIVELPCGGLLNSMGLPNPGVVGLYRFVKAAKRRCIPVIVSVGGSTIEEFREVAIKAEEAGADAVELNLGCPHTKGYGLELGQDPHVVYEVVREVSESIRIPISAKLGLTDRILEVAGKTIEAGARALTLINTIKAIYIDIYAMRPFLSNIYGGLSGPPIHPVAVRVVYDVYKEYGEDVEIIASGGAVDWYSVAEFLLAGAKAVQLGTALIIKREKAIPEILEGLQRWLSELNVKSVKEVIGLAARR